MLLSLNTTDPDRSARQAGLRLGVSCGAGGWYSMPDISGDKGSNLSTGEMLVATGERAASQGSFQSIQSSNAPNASAWFCRSDFWSFSASAGRAYVLWVWGRMGELGESARESQLFELWSAGLV
jgi:hypothetical protein